MTAVYVICFVLLTVGSIFLLGLTPDRIGEDIQMIFGKKETLRDKVLAAHGKKKSGKLIGEMNRIRDALEATGKGKHFSIACTASLVLIFVGCVLAFLLDNPFLIPVLVAALSMIPFGFIQRTLSMYNRQVMAELETALSVITTSYIRSDNLEESVRENLPYLKPPIREIFRDFCRDCRINPDTKRAIRNLKSRISDPVFHEWCDVLTSCQDDRTLKDTLMPVIEKLTDMRIVNGELKTMLSEVRREYYMMAGLVVVNIPLLYFLNSDWYAALMYTTVGKATLALCGAAIIVTFVLMHRFTKPVVYKR